MKIRMKIEVSGTRDGQPWPERGETVEVSDGEGAQLCAGGLADPVRDEKVETAVPSKEDVETRELTDSEKDADAQAALAREQAPDPAAVRAWAADNNVRVAAKGKVPDDVVAAYLKAQGGA